MTPKLTEDLLGSCDGRPPYGCRLCDRGTKLVLYITGVCARDCFYCPLSEVKKGNDVIFANERPVDGTGWLKEVLAEARVMKALGTGITGGDPMLVAERTVEVISVLKREFGNRHHVHLYTSGPFDPRDLRKVRDAGLNEIRFHPPFDTWDGFRFLGRDGEEGDAMDASIYHALILEARSLRLSVGLEVPALVDPLKGGNQLSEGLYHLVRYAVREGMDFVNLNELEASHTNMDEFRDRGYDLVEDSMAVKGSYQLAYRTFDKVRAEFPDARTVLHVCSSVYKDSVQLRNRLKRMADNVVRELEIVTEDGTLIRGIITAKDPRALMRRLSEEYAIPTTLMEPMNDKLLIAPWVLEEISSDLEEEGYISEIYPTWDGLEVERTPLPGKVLPN